MFNKNNFLSQKNPNDKINNSYSVQVFVISVTLFQNEINDNMQ